MEDVMEGGRCAAPVRKGDTVERNLSPGSGNVHALLSHFETARFRLAPRFHGITTGGDREIVSFIPGQTAYPPLAAQVRDDETLINVATAVRAMHDAAQGFTPPEPGRWHSPEVAMPLEPDCIGHRDLGPWNFIFHGTTIAGIIDWDFAGPTSRAWDLAYAAHHFVPFHATSGLAAWGWDTEPDRRRRLAMFAEAYGMGVTVDELIDLAIVRMTAMAGHIEARIRADDPAFEMHRRDGHAGGYRAAAEFIMAQRGRLLS